MEMLSQCLVCNTFLPPKCGGRGGRDNSIWKNLLYMCHAVLRLILLNNATKYIPGDNLSPTISLWCHDMFAEVDLCRLWLKRMRMKMSDKTRKTVCKNCIPPNVYVTSLLCWRTSTCMQRDAHQKKNHLNFLSAYAPNWFWKPSREGQMPIDSWARKMHKIATY